MTQVGIQEACRLIAKTYYGPRGTWLYDAFDAINEAFFGKELPTPLISVEITPHGGCLAWCSSADERPPRIAIHPTLFGVREKEDPWRLPEDWLGTRYVFDTLLHEAIHASVHYRLGGWEGLGSSSHNNERWIEEVNRISPMIGLSNVEAGRSVTKRVPIKGEYGKRGQPKTRVERVSLGNVPFDCVATFPQGLRQHFGSAARYYTRGRLPVKNLSVQLSSRQRRFSTP